MALTRGAVARRFGNPDDQLGSVNDPRTFEEFDVRWNEKWIYRDPHGAGYDLVVLWRRYDLIGAWRVSADGAWEPEEL